MAGALGHLSAWSSRRKRAKSLPSSPVTKSVSDQFVSGAMTMTRIAVSASNWAIIAMANAALV
jgi:hypothetical protein